jgi:hypothetical protein
MSSLFKVEKPYNVYNKLTLADNELSGPSGRKQVYDKKYNDRKRERLEEFGRDVNRRNIDDHIGSDGELAPVNAITTAFPDATHVFCTRHLRENAKQKLIDDSINKQDRNSMLDDIFGNDGFVCVYCKKNLKRSLPNSTDTTRRN